MNKVIYTIVSTVLLSITTVLSAEAQIVAEKKPFTDTATPEYQSTANKTPFVVPKTPEYETIPEDSRLRARPGGGDDTGIKQEPLPVSGGFWILAGLAGAYGIVRKRKNEK